MTGEVVTDDAGCYHRNIRRNGCNDSETVVFEIYGFFRMGDIHHHKKKHIDDEDGRFFQKKEILCHIVVVNNVRIIHDK